MLALPWAWLAVMVFGSLGGSHAAPAEVRCEPLAKFTTEWFLSNVRDEFKHRMLDNALFYSRGMSSAARVVAHHQDKKTIWDLWPCELYNNTLEPGNAMRCIFDDKSQRQSFFESMSLAFAKMASKGASVLHSAEFYDDEDTPLESIWTKVEYPELVRSGGHVSWLQKLKADASYPTASLQQVPGTSALLAWLPEAEKQWVESREGTKWLSKLRTGVKQWSEICWRRHGTSPISDWRPNELKRNEYASPSETYRHGKAGTACSSSDRLHFFDDNVDW